MSSFGDARGHVTAAASQEVVHQLDHAVDAYLGARLDTRDRLKAVLSSDPDCVMGHCFDGYLHMLSSKREGIHRARGALLGARSCVRPGRVARREELHLDALDVWSRGDMRDAVRHWDALLADHPCDVVAIKASQYVLSYLGESNRMRETIERVLPAWDPAMRGYGFVLGCYAYG
ncbi:MAG: hypothetical protein ACR2OU_00510, partial [Thermomicrobiales bacterium]